MHLSIRIIRVLVPNIIGGASAATVRSSKSRFAIDIICLVHANHTEHAQKGHRQARSVEATYMYRSVEKTGWWL